MTKEEYHKLLKSDYWKGFSYSIIKERNFTCEDCGAYYPNQRNKLEVHHLVYRDIAPWSYKPEEMIVLCEDCHKKRHGILTESRENMSFSHNPWEEDDKDYFSSTDSRTVNSFSSRFPHHNRNLYPTEPERPKVFKFKYIIYGILLFLVVMIGRDMLFKHSPESKNKSSEGKKELVIENDKATPSSPVEDRKSDSYRKTSSKKETRQIDNISSTPSVDKGAIPANGESTNTVANTAQIESPKAEHINEPSYKEADRELSSLEILERRNHADVVKRAQRAGVSTEGSTIEILERINHADVVKRAKRAGVSTEGTTIEILERINHADVVKRAQRAGVSTEGSTIEILERINHADVVKRAKRLGVSTEGSTIDILERINRKELEKYNY